MKKRRKFRCLRAEKVLRKEMPPVATRRGRPVWSSGTLETPVAGARRSEVNRSDISKRSEIGKKEHRQAERGLKPWGNLLGWRGSSFLRKHALDSLQNNRQQGGDFFLRDGRCLHRDAERARSTAPSQSADTVFGGVGTIPTNAFGHSRSGGADCS